MARTVGRAAACAKLIAYSLRSPSSQFESMHPTARSAEFVESVESTDASATARPLNRADFKTLGLSALGGALEFYDFIIFVFFTGVIGELFFPASTPDWLRQAQTFGLFAAGYLARPIGGIVMAHFGDRSGRKRMFTLSVLLMALPTLAMGLLPTYAQIGVWAPLALLALRLLQGAAIGGEVPGAWVFVSEHVPARRVGLACGALTCGLTLGILLGSLVASAINLQLDADAIRAWGWRLPFLLGGAFGLLAVWLRRWLDETPVFESLRARKALARELPLKRVLREQRRSVLLSILVSWLLTAAIVVVILMTPALMQRLFALPVATTLSANSVATFALACGCLAFGWAADRYGAARILGIGSALLLCAIYALYFGVAHDGRLLRPLYGIAGFCVGVVGVVPTIMVRAFEPAVRFSGLSFSYNLAYALFGGLTPLMVVLLMRLSPMAPAHYVAALCLAGVLVAIWLHRGPTDSLNRSV